MLSRERFEVQIGAIFVITIVLLVIGVIWAKRFKPGGADITVLVSFESVGGLLKGDNVFVSGVQLGSVRRIQLRERDVLVTADIEQPVRLAEDYRIRVIMVNFTGEMGLLISPGQGTLLDTPLPVLTGEAPLEIAEFATPVMETIRSVRNAADTLSWALPQITHRAAHALDRLDTVLVELGRGVSTNRVALKRTLDELQMTAAVLVSIPLVVLFFVFQKRYIQGVVITGVKG